MIRIVVVDDHPVVRAGLRTVLDAADDIDVVGEAHDHDTAVSTITELEPDVRGARRAPWSRSGVAPPPPAAGRHPVFDNDIDIDAAIEGPPPPRRREPHPRSAPFGPSLPRHPAPHPRVAARVVTRSVRNPDVPSPRELEVLAAVADGLDNATIARDLYISQATVKTHLASVFAKLGVVSRTGAVTEDAAGVHLR